MLPRIAKHSPCTDVSTRYASEDAQKAHIETPQCQAFIKAMEEEKFCSDAKIVFTATKADFGFASRL